MSSESRAIPEGLRAKVLELSAAFKSNRDIAAILQRDHQVTCSYKAIERFLKRERKDRSEGTKAAVRDRLVPAVLSGIDRLEVHAKNLHELALENKQDVETYPKLVEQLRKVTDTMLHYSGADTPDDSLSELNDAAKRVASRMARLSAAMAAGAVPEGTGIDPSGASGS